MIACALATLVSGGAVALRAQAPDPAQAGTAQAGTVQAGTVQLRAQLAGRYNLVPLQNGLALTPLKTDGTIRLIEIRDGVVSINGDVVGVRDLKKQLGADADLVLRATYLDAAAAKAMAEPAASAPAPAVRPTGDDRDRQRPPDSDGTRTEIRRGDIVRFGGGVNVAANESVEGDVVAIGGSADIDGEIRGELTVVGGSADLGPDAHVHGDVTVVGGSLNRAPGARIDGKVDEVGMSGVGPFGRGNIRGNPGWATFWRFGSLFSTLLRVTLLAMGVLLVTALGARYVETIGSRTMADPLRSGLTGLLAEMMFVPLLVITCVVLAISIVGIPLLLLVPFAVVLALVMMLVGFTGVVHAVGRSLTQRFGIGGGMYAQAMLGLLAIVGITVVAKLLGLLGGFAGFITGILLFVGLMVEYAAWTIGAGAVILAWYSTRRRGTRVGPAAAGAAGAVPVSEEGLR